MRDRHKRVAIKCLLFYGSKINLLLTSDTLDEIDAFFLFLADLCSKGYQFVGYLDDAVRLALIGKSDIVEVFHILAGNLGIVGIFLCGGCQDCLQCFRYGSCDRLTQ